MTVNVLYTSGEVHSAIKRVLTPSNPGDKRYALVAYLGAGADKFLPCPTGLTIVCCLQAPATSAAAIRHFMKLGATVLKSNRLHMKVYWSRDKGAVVSSANASRNALGKNGTKEAGVFLPAKAVDIRRLLEIAGPKKISRDDLVRLERQSDEITAISREPHESKDGPPGFAEWYTSLGRKPWKLGWWMETTLKTSQASKDRSKAMYAIAEPHTWLNCQKNTIVGHDWVLTYVHPTGLKPQWMWADFVVPVSSSDRDAYENEYPLQAAQVHASNYYANPPFQIDANFRGALKKSIKFGADKLESPRGLKPPPKFLASIYKHVQ